MPWGSVEFDLVSRCVPKENEWEAAVKLLIWQAENFFFLLDQRGESRQNVSKIIQLKTADFSTRPTIFQLRTTDFSAKASSETWLPPPTLVYYAQELCEKFAQFWN